MCASGAVNTPMFCVELQSFQPEPPVTARPSRSRQKQNTDLRKLRKLHRFTSNVGIIPVTDHHGLERGSFPVSCGVNFLTFGFLYTSQSTLFIFDFGRLQAKIALSSKTTGKRSHLVHFGYCHYVIKYLMRDMMNLSLSKSIQKSC